MIRDTLMCGLLLVGLAVSASLSVSALGEDKHDHLPVPPTNAGFDRMKTLAGTWVSSDKDGNPTDDVVSVIKLTAAAVSFTRLSFQGSRTK